MQLKLLRRIQWLIFAVAVIMSTDADARSFQIVALGDSNTAGFGVGKRNAFPSVLQASLRTAGYDVNVSNQGISGDTIGGVLSRLDAAVPLGTRIAIVQGGYNDRSRGDLATAQPCQDGIYICSCGLRSYGGPLDRLTPAMSKRSSLYS